VPPEREVDVHDEVGAVEAALDRRKGTEAVDDPAISGAPRIERRGRCGDRCAYPTGEPLHGVDLVERKAETFGERAGEGRFAAAAVADDSDAPRHAS
jgi:hypothetical protein